MTYPLAMLCNMVVFGLAGAFFGVGGIALVALAYLIGIMQASKAHE